MSILVNNSERFNIQSILLTIPARLHSEIRSTVLSLPYSTFKILLTSATVSIDEYVCRFKFDLEIPSVAIEIFVTE